MHIRLVRTLFIRLIRAARGTAAIAAIAVITLVGFVPLLPVALTKRLARTDHVRTRAGNAAVAVALTWAHACNAAVLAISGIKVSIQHEAADAPEGRFVLVGNHQCAADALFLVRALNGHFPFPRFCLKRSLRRLPVIGLAFWALDYIFVDRYSREAVQHNPALRGRDTASIERACRLFRDRSITFVNYPEGTRSTRAKRHAAGSPYRTLLPPRTGGFRYAVRGFGPSLDGILVLSIAYVDTPEPTFWALLSGRINSVSVRLRRLDAPTGLLTEPAGSGNQTPDPAREFLEARWAEKDGAIAAIQSPDNPRRVF